MDVPRLMPTPAELRAKLLKIEALFSGAATTGARSAAQAAIARLKPKAEAVSDDPPVEMQFSFADRASRQLFVALCRRYGLTPYRYPRQRRATVLLKAPRRFVEEDLMRQFHELESELEAYLAEVTVKVIREEIFADTSEAQEIPEALPAA
jgi:hypothetical protein